MHSESGDKKGVKKSPKPSDFVDFTGYNVILYKESFPFSNLFLRFLTIGRHAVKLAGRRRNFSICAAHVERLNQKASILPVQ